MKIIPPDGYEIDYESSTFDCIKFKKKENNLPETWEEFCELKPDCSGEYYLMLSGIQEITTTKQKREKFIVPNTETANALLALCQLIQLRDCYNDGWKPDWTDRYKWKYVIYFNEENIMVDYYTITRKVLAFKTVELRDKFLKNFEELIKIAKPLL